MSEIAPWHGPDFIKMMGDILGIDTSNVNRIEIEMRAGAPVVFSVYSYPDNYPVDDGLSKLLMPPELPTSPELLISPELLTSDIIEQVGDLLRIDVTSVYRLEIWAAFDTFVRCEISMFVPAGDQDGWEIFSGVNDEQA